MLLTPYGARAEQNVDELKPAEGSGEAGAWLPLWWLSHSVPYVPLLLQRKLPADSRVLEASELVYTVSAQEYWQRALLTEEETGNLHTNICIFIPLTQVLKNKPGTLSFPQNFLCHTCSLPQFPYL